MTWLWLAAVALVIALVARDRRRTRERAAMNALHRAFHRIGLGRLGEAERAIDEAERASRAAPVRRLVAMQRALVALRRGDLGAAREALGRAIALLETGGPRRAADVVGARAMRAFVAASLGDREAARADVEAVRASGAATADALARASLAEALVLESAGERDALRALLARDRDPLLEKTHPRERAIVRAFERMLRTKGSSVYRAQGEREPAAPAEDEPPLTDWVARVAPSAAPFVRAPRATAPTMPVGPAPMPTARAQGAIAAARVAGARAARTRFGRLVPILVAAGASLVGLGVLAAIAIAVHDSLDADAMIGALFVAAVAAALGTLFVRGALRTVQRRGATLRSAELAAAQATIARGRLEDAERMLADLATSELDLVAGQAQLELAQLAERRGDFAAVLRASDLGLGRLGDPATRAASGTLVPDLVAERALALVAHGREEEAHAELVGLDGFAYPHRARAVFRVRLAALARRGDVANAARFADEFQTDLPLSVREEVLADLVRAAAHPDRLGAAEAQRVRDELAEAGMRGWIAAVAPAALELFEASLRAEPEPEEPRLRIGIEHEDQHEHEALAELDAEAAPAPPRFLRRDE